MKIDRRIIYLLVVAALALPLYFDYSVTPARMVAAEKYYAAVENLNLAPGDIAFVSMDFGPNTKAENESQALVVVEHLMRRRIPFIVASTYVQAQPFLKSVPEKIVTRLRREFPAERWQYGKDWVNLGYLAGAALTIQAIPRADTFLEVFQRDAQGNALKDLPLFKDFKSFNQIKLLNQFTGLTGTLSMYQQFFQNEKHRPLFGHGCTSITIPEAFIFLDSGQLNGVLEGIAGAAWYSELLSRKFPAREKDEAVKINTGLGVAHVVIIVLILIGNLGGLLSRRRRQT